MGNDYIQTYQEAKIANPESEVAVVTKVDSYTPALGEFIAVVKDDNHRSGYSFVDKGKGGHPNTTDGYYTICTPADYCMTVEQFLNDGHKFIKGDHLLTDNITKVMRVGMEADWHGMSVNECNKPDDEVDDLTLVLRAAALEKPQPRTKANHVKVEFERAWEAVKAFEEGELFTNISADTYSKIETAPDVLRYFYRLYRRIESPITWQDEVKSYLDNCDRIDGSCILKDFSYKATSEHDHLDAENNEFDLEFVGLCHLVASMTDKPGV